jgi:hypothetical protein
LNSNTQHFIRFEPDALLIITLAIVVISFVDFSLVGTLFGTILTDKTYGINLFTLLTLACISSQIFFIIYTRSLVKNESWKKRLRYHPSWYLVVAFECLVATILLSITIQIITTLQYSSLLTSTLVTVSHITTLVFIGMLLGKLIKWIRSNSNLAVLVYILAISLLGANVLSLTIFHIITSASAPKVIDSSGCGLLCISQRPILTLIYSVTYYLSYFAIWFSSILLLYNFQKKMKKITLWTLILLPIPLLILSLNSGLWNILIGVFELDFLVKHALYMFLSNITGPLAGVVSGLVFWHMARNLYPSLMRRYVVLISYGIIILLSLNYSTGFQLFLFPPYGTISTSFMVLGSFGIFLGVYFSSVYVAQDSKLRAYITNPKSPVYKELKFFAATGTSENRERTVSSVTHVIKNIADEMEDESGVPLDEDKIMEYVKLAIEVRKKSPLEES